MASTLESNDTLLPNFIAGNLIVLIAAIAAVILRVIARRFQRLNLAADDYSIILALIFSAALVATNLTAGVFGIGRHAATLSLGEIVHEYKAFYASQVLWAVSVPAVKVSVLLLYLRIFGSLAYLRVMVYTLGVYSVLWGCSVILVVSLACQPFEYNWNKAIDGHCINSVLYYKIGSGLNTVTDFLVLITPLPAIWNLHTTMTNKLQISGIFLLGSLTCGISAARWASIFQLDMSDPTWQLTVPEIWSAAEPCLGILAACLATMRPLFRRKGSSSRGLSDDSDRTIRVQYSISLQSHCKDSVSSDQHEAGDFVSNSAS